MFNNNKSKMAIKIVLTLIIIAIGILLYFSSIPFPAKSKIINIAFLILKFVLYYALALLLIVSWLGKSSLITDIAYLFIDFIKIILPEMKFIVSITTYFGWYIIAFLLSVKTLNLDNDSLVKAVYIGIIVLYIITKSSGDYLVDKINTKLFKGKKETSSIANYKEIPTAILYLIFFISTIYNNIYNSVQLNTISVISTSAATICLMYDSTQNTFKKVFLSIIDLRKGIKARAQYFKNNVIEIKKRIMIASKKKSPK